MVLNSVHRLRPDLESSGGGGGIVVQWDCCNWAGKVPGVRGILVITVDNVVIRQWRRGQD